MERGRDGRAALDHRLHDPLPAELVEHVVEVTLQLERGLDLRSVGRMSEHDPQRVATLDVADGERRVVGAHGAGADDDRVALGPQPVGVAPRGVAGDPLARAVGRRGAAVEGGRELEHDVGPAGAAVLQVRRELCTHLVRAHADGDVDPRGTQPSDALSPHVRVGVLDADDDPGDAGSDDRVGAGRGAAVM